MLEELYRHVPALELVVAVPLAQLQHLLVVLDVKFVVFFGVLSGLGHEPLHLFDLLLLEQNMVIERHDQLMLRLAALRVLLVARVVLVAGFENEILCLFFL